MEKTKFLSVIIPAYKQEKTISSDIKNLDKVLSKLSIKHELIVVVDGFLDKTYEIASKLKNKNIKVVGYKDNKGKGYAIRLGVMESKGDVIGFIDAGMDIDPKSISKLLFDMERLNSDIAIGSKLHPDSKVKYPFVRKILSWGYRNISYILFGLKIRDTQAGLKLYKSEVAQKIFKLSTVNDFAFDIETLALANKIGFKKIYEGPVKLNFKENTITNVNFIFVAIKMFIETIVVFLKLKFNMYKITK